MRMGTLSIAVAMAFVTSACGVRQFNGRIFRTNGGGGAASEQAHAPFYAAGQGGESMSSAGCNTVSGRPCLRARASIGIPFRFDVNANAKNGVIAGTQYPVIADPNIGPFFPYGGTTIPGKTEATATRGGNYDLHLMQRQAGTGLVSF